ncbi:MAG: glycosyltransferase family 39 protein [Candidatus Eisenbacteria bacterium]|nr:glycosyltransferase family 39 protein [Candidatus Eisenbacteria bacterium]
MAERSAKSPFAPARALGSRRILLVSILLSGIVFLAFTVTSLQTTSATFDEPVYVVGGLASVTLHDFTMKDDAPPLVGALAGLGARAAGLTIPGSRLPFQESLGREYPYATSVLYGGAADADRVLFASRLAVLLPFGLLLLAAAGLWSRDLWGTPGAMLTLALTALSPNLIAFAGVVSADLPCAASMLAAAYLLWRGARRRSPSGLLIAGVALGLALLTKFTALLLLPVVPAVLLATSGREPGGGWVEAGAGWRGRVRAVAIRTGWVLLPAALLVVLAFGLPPQPGRYFANLGNVYRNVKGTGEYHWYLFGAFRESPIPYYYPVVLALKGSVPVIGMGIASVFFLRRRTAGLAGELALWLPALLLLAVASADAIPAGIRRVLPVLPVLTVSAGRLAPPAWRPWRWRSLPAAAAILWLAVTTSVAWPHYLAYFNEPAGGWRNGPRLLDDVNIDWGQDLKQLPAAMRAAGFESVRLFYFGTADPAWYRISAEPASLAQLGAREPGDYAISSHFVIRMREKGIDWPSRERPAGRAGTSILLYRIEEKH